VNALVHGMQSRRCIVSAHMSQSVLQCLVDPISGLTTYLSCLMTVSLSMKKLRIACGMLVDWTEHWPGVSFTLSILGSPGLGLWQW